MASWDFWANFPLLTKMVEDYRKGRDPAPLTRFIELNPEAMCSPAIGKLFLDMLNNNLPMKKKPETTKEVRVRAVDLVFFYVGQGLDRSYAYSQAAGHLGYGDESSVRDFVKTWIEQRLSEKWNGAITLKEFWSNPEKYTQHSAAFHDGKTMIDDELARKAVIRAGCPDMSIKEYRKILNNLYEKGTPLDCGDPWEAAKKEAMLALESQRFNDGKNRE